MSLIEAPRSTISPVFLRIAGALLIVAAAPAVELAVPSAGVLLAFLQSIGLAAFYVALIAAGYPRRDGTSIALAVAQAVVHVLIIVVVLTPSEVATRVVLVILLAIVLYALNIAFGVTTWRTRSLLDPLRQLPIVLVIGTFLTNQFENLVKASWSHILTDLLYVVVGILFMANAAHPEGRTLEEARR